MKIGFYGNANNYPFMLARAFRRAGHQVEFFVLSRERLNRPEFRYQDMATPYPAWVHDVSAGPRWRWLLPGRQRIFRVLNACDFVFFNEEGAALAAGLRVPYAVLITGSDLHVFAHPENCATLAPSLTRWRNPSALLNRLVTSLIIRPLLQRPHRRGVQQAAFATHFARGLSPEGDLALDALGFSDARRLFLLMTDLELIPPSPPPTNARIRTFCATRFTWVREENSGLMELDYKGSDVMLRGLAEFWHKTGIALDIHLVRKGRHVPQTVALAEQLGLMPLITWHDEMSQAEVLEEYHRADIIFEQFASSVVAMAGLDAMAAGRPLIANWRPEILDRAMAARAPICQARTPVEVCAWLERLVADAALRQRLGEEGRTYVSRYFSADAGAAACLRMIRQTTTCREP